MPNEAIGPLPFSPSRSPPPIRRRAKGDRVSICDESRKTPVRRLIFRGLIGRSRGGKALSIRKPSVLSPYPASALMLTPFLSAEYFPSCPPHAEMWPAACYTHGSSPSGGFSPRRPPSVPAHLLVFFPAAAELQRFFYSSGARDCPLCHPFH